MNLHDGTPFWPRRDGILAVHPPVSEDLSCDVLVVGAGITGSLVSLELTRRGLDVVVVDRRDAGGGSTSASTALLQYEIDELLIDLARTIGWDDAEAAYRECNRAIDLIEQATQTVGHNCGFRRSPSIFTAIRKSDIAVLHGEYEARRRAGFDVSWLDETDAAGPLGDQRLRGDRVATRRLRRSLLVVLPSARDGPSARGGRSSIEPRSLDSRSRQRRARMTTSRGTTITARHVVLATGYEVKQLLPDLPISLHTTFALVTEPLDGLDSNVPGRAVVLGSRRSLPVRANHRRLEVAGRR